MTHVFALGHLLGRPGCGPLVDHGVQALQGRLRDLAHGGWFAAVGEDGVTDSGKEPTGTRSSSSPPPAPLRPDTPRAVACSTTRSP